MSIYPLLDLIKFYFSKTYLVVKMSNQKLQQAEDWLLDCIVSARDEADLELRGYACDGRMPREYQLAREILYKYLGVIEAGVKNTFEYNLRRKVLYED